MQYGAMPETKIILCALAAFFAVSSPIWADTYHNDYITGDSLWTADGNNHIVDIVTIATGGSLTIEDGCVVEFETGGSIEVDGALYAPGTSGDGVLFTNRGIRDDYDVALHFESGSSGILTYCTFNGASGVYGYAIHADESFPTVENCTIENNGHGIYAERVDYPVLSVPNTFQDNNLSATYFMDCQGPSISNQTMTGHTGDYYGAYYGAIYMVRSGEFEIGTGNSITGNTWGLSMDGGSYPSASSAGNIPTAGNINADGIRAAGSGFVSGVVWRDVGADYIVTTSGLTPVGTLEIEEGVTVKFEDGTRLAVSDLQASGTSGAGIRLTRRDAADTWLGVRVGSTSRLEYCTIEYAERGIDGHYEFPSLGYCTIRNNSCGAYAYRAVEPSLSDSNYFEDNAEMALHFRECTRPAVSGQKITGSTGPYGAIYMEDTGEFTIGPNDSIVRNTWGLTIGVNSYPSESSYGNIPAAGNTNDDGMQVLAAAYPDSVVWNNVGEDYIVTFDHDDYGLVVHGPLVVKDGVKVLCDDSVSFDIYGTLDAVGTSGQGILFSRRDSGEHWAGLRFNDAYGQGGGSLRYCTIEYVSSGLLAAGIHGSGVFPVVEHCTIRNNDVGINPDGIVGLDLSVPNTFEDNEITGARFYFCSGTTVANQTFTGHTGYYPVFFYQPGAMCFEGGGEFTVGTGNVITGNAWAVTMDGGAYPSDACWGNIPTSGNFNNDGIQVAGGGGVSSPSIWRKLDVDYVITQGAYVRDSLTIEDGVVVKCDHGGLIMNSGSALRALGTSDAGITFTRRNSGTYMGGYSLARDPTAICNTAQ